MTRLDGIAVIGTSERLCGPEQPQEPRGTARREGSPGNENRDRDAAQRRAVTLTRALSAHHNPPGCPVCARGGRVELGAGGVRRVRCEAERRLLAELAAAQDEGWPV